MYFYIIVMCFFFHLHSLLYNTKYNFSCFFFVSQIKVFRDFSVILRSKLLRLLSLNINFLNIFFSVFSFFLCFLSALNFCFVINWEIIIIMKHENIGEGLFF